MGTRQVMYSDGTPSREVEDDGMSHPADMLINAAKRHLKDGAASFDDAVERAVIDVAHHFDRDMSAVWSDAMRELLRREVAR